MELKHRYKQSEVGVIPEDWDVADIKSVCDKIIDYRGRTPLKLGMEWGGDIPALSAGNVKMGRIDFDEECYFGSENLYKRWMTQGHTKKNDIVVTMEAPLGNIALIPDNRKYILSQRTILLQTSKVMHNIFLFQVLSSGYFQNLLAENSTGSTAKGIQRRRFEKLNIFLPPLPEQRVIAAALGDVAALIVALDALIVKKRDLKLAAMQQLLTGKQRLPGFSGEWSAKNFGGIASPRKQRVNPLRLSERPFCVELEDIEQNTGKLNVRSLGEQSSLKSSFFVGDVLFGKLRAYLRKHWLADRDGICSTEIWPLVPNLEIVTSAYLLQIVKSDGFIEAANMSYGTHMPRSEWKSVSKFEVTLPSLEEQIAIAEVLSDMDAELAALEAKRDKTRDLKRGMMQELLTGRTRLMPTNSNSLT